MCVSMVVEYRVRVCVGVFGVPCVFVIIEFHVRACRCLWLMAYHVRACAGVYRDSAMVVSYF